MRVPAALIAVAFVACNGGEQGPGGFSSSITTAPQGTTSTSSGGETSTSSSTSSAEDSAAASSASSTGSTTAGGVPDVGAIPDGGDGPPPGCKGKVDFLFTISGALTMAPEQERLKASFPGFIATLESEFADFDYHILSANTAGFWGYPSCKGCQDVCAELPEFPCGVQPEPCDLVRGAGMTYPIGKDASNKRCELASGLRYITAGQPDLVDAFTCIASMGSNGSEHVAEVTVMALADEMNNAPGACNEGFLRDDALLVVVAIMDGYDSYSAGTPEDWRDALVEAKGGDADAVVLLVISTDIDDPVGLCGYDPGDEHELRTWTELMQPNALFGSICAEGYSDYFATVAKMIKSQCDVFVPQ
ncbi:hypothetical protein [Nannocystis punicea]|uniref:VWFA domain-containing protein n=1 Tax=Nannocystis punicea TaxID=2995304 RepID=A0ABY7H0Z2_9BACT|nr:hypothetical protein [Nannocystis poenicansa]WAS92921.1 hypothetical protein O0S08_42670 [Nannocystis poenicansa]